MTEVPEVVVVVESTGNGSLTQRIESRQHASFSDEPLGAGNDAGPTPYELLLAALGACTSMTLGMYAKHKNIALDRISIRLTYNRVHVQDCENAEEKTKRVHRFERELTLVGDIGDEERERLRKLAEQCAVHRTLMEEKEIVTTLV
jgi:putative redox protein